MIALYASPNIISSEYYDEDNNITTNKSVLGIGGIAELPRREIEEKPLAKLNKMQAK